MERLKQIRSERDGRNKNLRSQLQDARAQIRSLTAQKDSMLDEAKEAAEAAKAQVDDEVGMCLNHADSRFL